MVRRVRITVGIKSHRYPDYYKVRTYEARNLSMAFSKTYADMEYGFIPSDDWFDKGNYISNISVFPSPNKDLAQYIACSSWEYVSNELNGRPMKIHSSKERAKNEEA